MEGFTTELAVIALMLVFNAGFAAYEMALASVPKARMRHLVEKNVPGSASAQFMKERLEASLSLIQLGITVAAAAAAATGGAGITENLSPMLQARYAITPGAAEALGIVLFVIPLSFVTILFGELVPKIFAIENKEFILLKFSPFFRGLYILLSPLLAIFEAIIKAMMHATRGLFPARRQYTEKATLSELRHAAAQARDEALIGRMEEKIVNAAAALAARKVEELMIPVSAISYIPSDMTLQEALIRAHMDLHTRFPVTQTDWAAGSVIGYVNFKDIVNALKMRARSPDIAGITRPIEKIRSGTSAPKALEEMITRNMHMALIIDGDGKTLGLLTLEDIIGQLVGGPIKDEYDRLPTHLYAAGGGFIAGGGADMAEILRKLGLKPETGNITLAAWLEKQLGRPPRGSETYNGSGIDLIVRKTRRHKVSEAFIRKAHRSI